MEKPISLELFSGSKTVSTVLSSHGFDARTVDINEKLTPSLCCNILNFNYKDCPGEVELIWASPDCTCFSRTAESGLWKKEIKKYRQYNYTPLTKKSRSALLLLIKTIEIIKHYKPAVWFIENPVGRMRHIPELQLFAPFRYSVNYKDFGFDYSKETDIYTNQYLNFEQKKIIRPGKGLLSINSKYKRSIVPAQLIESILQQIGY